MENVTSLEINDVTFPTLQEIYKKHGDWLTPYKVFKKINGRSFIHWQQASTS